MTNNKYKILLVEDDGSIRSIMTTMLESAGYQVIPADTCGLAKTLFASHLPDVTILDLGLPDMDGMRMLEFVRKDLESGDIRLLKTDFTIPERSVDMCTLKEVPPTAAASAFMEMVQKDG